MMVRLMIVFFFVVLCAHGGTCDIQQHTACTFVTTKSNCQRIIKSGLTKEEKQQIIDLHNEYRQYVANGNETRGSPGPQPPAKNMPNVEWDEELASIAQKWADQCTFSHDSCREVARFKIGQNIAYVGTTADVNTLKVDQMVKMWYDEVEYFNKNDVSRFGNRGANGKPIGHYTQLIWEKSTKIGCGAVKYNDGKFNRFYLVCNYGPAGNVLGQPIYETR